MSAPTVPVLLFAALAGFVLGQPLLLLARGLVQGDKLAHSASQYEGANSLLVMQRQPLRYCVVGGALLAAAFTTIVYRYGASLEAVEYLGFASILYVLALTDFAARLIPNACIAAAFGVQLVYLAVAAALGHLMFVPTFVASLLSMLAVLVVLAALVLIMDRILGRPSMGGGDIKLFAVAAFYLGWEQFLFLLLISCVFGIAFALISAASSAGEEQAESAHNFPFGPAIALACWLTMLCGTQLVNEYCSFML